MRVHLTCPSGHWLAAEDPQPGQKLRCPDCHAVFLVPDPDRSAGELAEEDRPDDTEAHERERDSERGERRPARKMTTRQRMSLTRLGLAFHYAKFLCTIVAITLSVVGISLSIITRGGALAAAVSCLSSLTYAVTPILGLVGSLLCFWVPRKSRSRLFVQISFGLDAGSLLFVFLSVVAGLAGAAGAGVAFFVLGALASFAGSILFLIFLRALALYLDDEASADEAIQVMVRWIAATVAPPVALFLLGAAVVRTRSLAMTAFVLYGGLLAWLVLYVKVLLGLLDLLATLRGKIASRYD